MKVKNGIASRVSLRHDAADALGQRLQEIGTQQSEPDADEREDQADDGQRERRPDSPAAETPPATANMIGAMLWMHRPS